MTIKSLLFCLFLYVGLVWVAVAYWFTGADIRRYGLLGTAIGLAAVLVLVIGARVLSWWHLWRAKAAVRPAAAAKPPVAGHPDDEALAALINEANATLAKSESFAGKAGNTPIGSLPFYLLVGPEGSGKTSTFVNSGLEPLLLAGQVSGTTQVVSTRLCNLWLAKGAVFAEIGGRIFSAEVSRWSQFIGVFRGNEAIPKWRRLWGSHEPRRDFRGVIAFCESKEFTAASADPQRLERFSRDWQERLRSIAELFGSDFPVYLVITKCDKIAYFSDFFRRLPEPETHQVLGCTLLPRQPGSVPAGEVFAEAEAKRLTASFRPLYHALAARRLTQLAHEPDPAQRPGIYEFPRELKRIRSPLVQFLTDVFRPHSLGPTPVLRGYYLTGAREGEVAVNDPIGSRVYSTPMPMEATKLFRGDATVFQTGDLSKGQPPGGRRNLGLRWVFVADLFHKVVLADQPPRKLRPIDGRFEQQRKLAFGALCGLCIVLCFAFLLSWTRNRGLLQDVEAAAGSGSGRHSNIATLSDLQTLDSMRAQIIRLREGLPISFHWGLYSGDRILEAARANYFRRFHQLLLIDLNSVMTSYLGALPSDPDENSPSDPVYRTLKAHILITTQSCPPDSRFLSNVLKGYRPRIAPNTTSDWQGLADRQIEFYASELDYGSPIRLPLDTAVRDRARQYLGKIRGVDRFYAGILAKAEKSVAKTARLSDLSPNYAKVLTGPDVVSSAFSREGWTFLEKASKEGLAAAEGEACVVGEPSGIAGAWKQNAETAQVIQRMFVRDYVESWRKFVEGFSVVRYASAADAAQKLEVLAENRSPLLAVLNLTANQTYFQSSASQASGALENVPLIGKTIASMKKAEDKAKATAANLAQIPDSLNGPADITRSFQPVHWVEPPGSETWVGEKNAAYVEALAQLRHSMQEIADSGRDPAVHQAAAQNYEKALGAVHQIALGFKPVGVAGLDGTVQRLLEDPIRKANPFIIRDMEKAGADKINSDLRAFCKSVQPTFRKYPILTSSTDDALPEELTRAFGPGQGIWKFQQQSIAEMVVKEGSEWKLKDPAKKPQVTADMLKFLNSAQQILNSFYSSGAPQPQLTYTLRPKLDSNFKDSILELEIDGQLYQWTGALQKAFTWPAPPGTKDLGAIARLRIGGTVAFPFASRPGVWGIFRILGDAEPREYASKLVEWKYSSGGVGRREPISPAPVQLEIVTFPGGVDVFNPNFWRGLQCPTLAVQ